MIVNVCGFGWSGSGAFVDLLREYDETIFPCDEDWEFNFLWAPDGLYDLEQKLCVKHCRIFESDLAINRFLSIAKEYRKGRPKYDRVMGVNFYEICKSYIDKLVQFEFEANCFVHRLHPTVKDRIINFYHKLLWHIFLRSYTHVLDNVYYKLRIDNCKLMRIAYNPNNFQEVTIQFVEYLVGLLRKGRSGILVLNQSVPPDMPNICNHFFKEEQKTIVVRRDPRDTFILINELRGKNKPVPRDVDSFIVYFKKTIADTIYHDNNSLLSLQFEDLIYDYNSTVKKIESFIGIKLHKKKQLFFDPSKSINNTQLFNLYPKYENDIKRIELDLARYLYPFEKKVFRRSTNKIF